VHRRAGIVTHSVIAGLDPAIHQLRKALANMMDARAFASPKRLRPGEAHCAIGGAMRAAARRLLRPTG
jgi:hypothetical protein